MTKIKAGEGIQIDDIDRGVLDFDDVHDIWHDVEELFAPIAFMERIGKRRRVPLPAFLMGMDGERTVDRPSPRMSSGPW